MQTRVRQKGKIILVVDGASKSKRHDAVLNALGRAAKLDPNLHVMCIGGEDTLDSEWWKYLQQKSKRSLFLNRIHWIGQRADEMSVDSVGHLKNPSYQALCKP